MHLSLTRALCAVVTILSAPFLRAADFPVAKGETSYTSGGKKIRVETWLPKDQLPHPAVLVLYGSGGNLLGKKDMTSVAKRLAGEGFSVFLIHYFNRTGTIAALDKQIYAYSKVWVETVHDGAEFVARHPHVSQAPMGIYGYSLGGYMAVAESSQNPRIGAVAEMAGGVFEALKGKIKRLAPLLILHGKNDERVRVEEGQLLERTARKVGALVETKYYDNEGHQLSEPSLADAQNHAIQFLRKRLLKR